MNETFLTHFREMNRTRGICLDPFQEEAIAALAADQDVLVSAPTGAGKTVVAEFAVELAFLRATRCIYTAPIKALSNQKFRELAAQYGAEHVGLLTGDVTINREAQILVMTTEVLRNMLFAQDQSLQEIGYVVLDEVHYLANQSRGPVWEEIILQLPQQIRLVSLSATIANLAEFTAWLRSVRGQTHCVISTVRPVPLTQLMLSHGKLVPLFLPAATLADTANLLHPSDLQEKSANSNDGATFSAQTQQPDSAINKDVAPVSDAVQLPHPAAEFNTAGVLRAISREQNAGNIGSGRGSGGAHKRITPALRKKVALQLRDKQLLPAIEFIFSRKNCNRAVKDLLEREVCFTTPAQQREIRRQLQILNDTLTSEERRTIQFEFWSRALVNGIAAHHAGMFPAIKELVEKLTSQCLISLIYATGTLSLGIDLPVRTVVLEELYKWNGEVFKDLSGTEYTQLIGRAGRRGKDVKGNAIVLARPHTDVNQLAVLSSGQLEPLNSAFFPSYNTVVNLVASYGYPKARLIMGTSFAQYQQNAQLGETQGKISRISAKIAQLRPQISEICKHGDLADYLALRARSGRASKSARKRAKAAYRREIDASWRELENGTLYAFAFDGEIHYGVVLSHQSHRARIINLYGDLLWINFQQISAPARKIDVIALPHGISPKQNSAREIISQQIYERVAERIDLGQDLDLTGSWDRFAVRETPEIMQHPVHHCVNLAQHLRDCAEYLALYTRLDRLRAAADAADDSVAKSFDAAAHVLGKIGMLQAMPEFVAPDYAGTFAAQKQLQHRSKYRDEDYAQVYMGMNARLLRGIHNENDLLISLCLSEPEISALSPAQFAGFCAAFLGDKRIGKLPLTDVALRKAWKRVEANYYYLYDLEAKHAISLTTEPNISGMQIFTAWAAGESLGKILRSSGAEIGDFIGSARRLLDLLGQLMRVGENSWIALRAEEAISLVRRWNWL